MTSQPRTGTPCILCKLPEYQRGSKQCSTVEHSHPNAGKTNHLHNHTKIHWLRYHPNVGENNHLHNHEETPSAAQTPIQGATSLHNLSSTPSTSIHIPYISPLGASLSIRGWTIRIVPFSLDMIYLVQPAGPRPGSCSPVWELTRGPLGPASLWAHRNLHEPGAPTHNPLTTTAQHSISFHRIHLAASAMLRANHACVDRTLTSSTTCLRSPRLPVMTCAFVAVFLSPTTSDRPWIIV